MWPHTRALEDIKDELSAISDRSNAADYKRSEADMHAVCELSEALRDSIFEYQVRPVPKYPISQQNSFLTQWTVLTTKDSIRAEP